VVAPSWGDLLGNGEGVLRTHQDLSLPAHAAARACLFAELNLQQRAAVAACHGHGASAWLAALPTPGLNGTGIHGVAMRAAARVWLGAPAHAGLRGRVCACGAAVGASGAHFLGTCVVQRGRHQRLHSHVVRLLAAALRRAGGWTDIAVEVGLDGVRDHLRPDLVATCTSTGVRTWGDVSFASPFADDIPARASIEPLRAVVA